MKFERCDEAWMNNKQYKSDCGKYLIVKMKDLCGFGYTFYMVSFEDKDLEEEGNDCWDTLKEVKEFCKKHKESLV